MNDTVQEKLKNAINNTKNTIQWKPERYRYINLIAQRGTYNQTEYKCKSIQFVGWKLSQWKKSLADIAITETKKKDLKKFQNNQVFFHICSIKGKKTRKKKK